MEMADRDVLASLSKHTKTAGSLVSCQTLMADLNISELFLQDCLRRLHMCGYCTGIKSDNRGYLGAFLSENGKAYHESLTNRVCKSVDATSSKHSPDYVKVAKVLLDIVKVLIMLWSILGDVFF